MDFCWGPTAAVKLLWRLYATDARYSKAERILRVISINVCTKVIPRRCAVNAAAPQCSACVIKCRQIVTVCALHCVAFTFHASASHLPYDQLVPSSYGILSAGTYVSSAVGLAVLTYGQCFICTKRTGAAVSRAPRIEAPRSRLRKRRGEVSGGEGIPSQPSKGLWSVGRKHVLVHFKLKKRI